MKSANESALRGFDDLPASGNVRLPVVQALFGVSAPTIWRWSRKGLIPAPAKCGGVTVWPVAGLRESLRGMRDESAA